MHTRIITSLAVFAALIAGNAAAAPDLVELKIGDQSAYDFTTNDGKQVSSKANLDKMVVLEFCATW